MGSGSFRQEQDKTAFESLQAAADQSLINFPLDDVTSWAPATTKGMCVCVKAQKYCTSGMRCVFGPMHLAYKHSRLYFLVCVCGCEYRSQIQLSLLFIGL